MQDDRHDPTGVGSLSRREFLRICSTVAVALGLPLGAEGQLAAAASDKKERPSVIWLHFQECTGCTESLLRTSHPSLQSLLLDLISLDYHETLFAAAGKQAEEALHEAMKKHKGKYVCIVEGAIPTKDQGIYCKIGGKTAWKMLQEVAPQAGAIIAIGSCASFGGLQAADPNPTGAKGVPQILKSNKVVTLPGCPANPYNLLSTVLYYLTYKKLPALDSLGRPLFAYGRTIHEHCPRRPHFDAGRFARQYGDKDHRQGHCLYRLGCKGPATHANCPSLPFCEMPGAWPIGVGHPCVGCTEQALLFREAIHNTVEIKQPTPPSTPPALQSKQASSSGVAAGAVGGLIGALVSAGVATAVHLSRSSPAAESTEEEKS